MILRPVVLVALVVTLALAVNVLLLAYGEQQHAFRNPVVEIFK